MTHVERGFKLGKWLRRFRERQGMTQTEVARAVGVTPACLSQLENDKRITNAPMLRRILSAMNVHSLGDFFYAVERGEQPIHRIEDRVPLFDPSEPLKAEYIGPRGRNFNFFLSHLDMEPDYEQDEVEVSDEEICIYVLEGKLGITLDNEDYEVLPGEACFIHASCPHKSRNLSDGHTKVIAMHVAASSRPLRAEDLELTPTSP